MRKSRFTEKQVIGFIKQAEAGLAVKDLCRKGGFGDATFYTMIEQCDLSEWRACRLVGLSRESYRDPPEADAMTQELSSKIVEIAHARRRFGYQPIHDVLRPHFPGVNHKSVYRLYSAANLAERKRKRTKRAACELVPLQQARTGNEVWSMDFVSDSLSTGRRIKCLTVDDDFSHECVSIAVDWGIPGQYVTRLLDQAAVFRGYPLAVRTDNSPELTSRAFWPGPAQMASATS